MAKHRFTGGHPVAGGEGGMVRPGDERDEADLPDFGPWEEIPEPEPEPGEEPAPPPPPPVTPPVTPPAPPRPPTASTPPATGNGGN